MIYAKRCDSEMSSFVWKMNFDLDLPGQARTKSSQRCHAPKQSGVLIAEEEVYVIRTKPSLRN